MASRNLRLLVSVGEEREVFYVASVHYAIGIIKRKKGNSSVDAAAYRAAEKIYDHRTGLWHDYTRKTGVVHTEILLPEQAPAMYHDRAILWNAVEHAEPNKNSQVSRDLIVGLPVELDRAAQIALIRDHVQREYVSRGMCADICIHDPKGKDPNPHAHVMFTMRPINPDGTWGDKSRREYVLDRNGQRILLDSGKDWKTRKVALTDWDERENVEQWRKAWERDTNRAYREHGIEQEINMSSYAKQGIDREPQEHMGAKAMGLENKGVRTEKGDRNRDVAERNAARERGGRERSRGRERDLR